MNTQQNLHNILALAMIIPNNDNKLVDNSKKLKTIKQRNTNKPSKQVKNINTKQFKKKL